MLYIAVPKYPGANDNSEWWCIFESGAVRPCSQLRHRVRERRRYPVHQPGLLGARPVPAFDRDQADLSESNQDTAAVARG